MNQQNQNKDFFLSPEAAKKNASYFRARAREAIKPYFWALIVIALLASLLGGTSEGIDIGSMIPSIEISEDVSDKVETAIKEILVLLMDGDFGTIFSQYPFVSTILIAVLCVAGVSLLYSLLVGSAVELGHQKIYLNLIDGEAPETKGLLAYFKKSYGKAIFARLLRMLINFAVSIPVLVSAILFASSIVSIAYYALMGDEAQTQVAISSIYLFTVIAAVLLIATALAQIFIHLRYAFVTVILAEYPELGVIDAFRNSASLMKGQKWRLFCLQFSFIGWRILAGLVPYGLGTYILMPYTMAADVAFYHEIAHRSAAEETEFPSLDPNDYDPNEARW
ncbi:MAG: DUF975 family protein [Clostridia bacterium]|nr:DUF975 family protein [Clostridia bacterium]